MEQAYLREIYGHTPCPALDFFQGRKDPGGIAVYDMRTALKDYVTDPYSMHMAKDILENHPESVYFHANEEKDRDGTRTFLVFLSENDSLFGYSFTAGHAQLTGNELYLDASGGYLDESGGLDADPDEYFDEEAEDESGKEPDDRIQAERYLNINGLILCKMLWVETDKLADETSVRSDENAKSFFSSLEKVNRVKIRKTETPEPHRKKSVELYPRIIIENGEAKLSFRIQKAGGKVIVIRNVRELVAACVGRHELTLSKTESIDFGEYEFTDRSVRLYDFLQRKVGDVSDLNSQIQEKNMRSGRSVKTVNVTSNLNLKGAVLDNFYDVWEGQNAEYQDKTNGVASREIPVTHRDIRLSLTCDRLSDAKGVFAGIAVQGLIPVLHHGSGSHR
ncbi:MAG: hypothetical protein LUF34_08135, partial [Lachnospiraceae bacterium]|nr:hypothetical protein [Lachnospiraceae bacterium]